MRVVVVENDPLAPVGRLEPHLDRHDVMVVAPAEGDALPEPGEFDAAVILGGRMGAYETDIHPWLDTEIGWLTDLVEAGTPTLAICLGSQMLAAATGGRAFKADAPEVGVVELTRTEAGRNDEVFGAVGGLVLSVHSDTFELAPNAVLLAHSQGFPHAFRVGSAMGLQFHPETSGEQAIEWLTNPNHEIQHGLSPRELSRLTTQIMEVDAQRADDTDRFFEKWFSSLLEKIG